jgi:iron(III) transport system permease protein
LIVTRTSFRYKRMLRALSVLPIITPPFVIGLGLILMFGRAGRHQSMARMGLRHRAIALDLRASGAGARADLFVHADRFPGADRRGRRRIAEHRGGAQTLRASRWRTFVDVSLPLMRPGLANAFLISFIESIADFGNPIVLGGNFGVLATEVFFSVVGAQLDQGRAATLGILLLLFALVAFFAQRRVLGRKVYTALAGKGDAGLPTPLPPACAAPAMRWRCPWAALTSCDLRDGDAGRLRRAMGTQLHADVETLCEGVLDRMGQRRDLWSGTPGTRSGPPSSFRRIAARSPRFSASSRRTS